MTKLPASSLIVTVAVGCAIAASSCSSSSPSAAEQYPPVSIPGGSPVQVGPRTGDGTVAGTIPGGSAGGVASFSVRATGTSSAEARYLVGSEEIRVSLSGGSSASVTFRGSVISGHGAISQEGQADLQALMEADGEAIKRIPLELGCGQGLEPAEMAVLLFPWQLGIKHTIVDRQGDLTRLSRAATCTYPLAAGSPKPPSSGLVSFSEGDPIPTVLGYFPLDAAGALESAGAQAREPTSRLSTNTPLAACGAKCRGACGPDCEQVNNCRVVDYSSVQCPPGPFVSGTSDVEYDCGVDQACINHDACYDRCNALLGCGNMNSLFCMHDPLHGCDFTECIASHGLLACDAWRQGKGPYGKGRVRYQYSETLWDASQCPNCVPNCAGRCGGPDGCGTGGTCDGHACPIGEVCLPDGACGIIVCTRDCQGKTCGSDGCGGSCGECTLPAFCQSGSCACLPQCSGKCGGSDGCGGTCGAAACAPPATCQLDGACKTACEVTPCTGAATCQPDGTCKTSCEVTPCTGVDSCQPDGTCKADCAANPCPGGEGCQPDGTCVECSVVGLWVEMPSGILATVNDDWSGTADVFYCGSQWTLSAFETGTGATISGAYPGLTIHDDPSIDLSCQSFTASYEFGPTCEPLIGTVRLQDSTEFPSTLVRR